MANPSGGVGAEHMIESLVARAARTSGLAALCLVSACSRADAPSGPPDRTAELSAIEEEVLRYELRQFAVESSPGADAAACVAIRDGKDTKDPSDAVVERLRRNGPVQPRSSCSGDQAFTVVAGPVEWRGDDEVYVSGGYIRPGRGETPLKYRVVWEEGRWRCVGPILSWAPL